MSDGDIPGRLRIWADGLEIVKSHAQALMARTAADEIERLRVERDEARRVSISLQVQGQWQSGQPNYLKETEWQAKRRIAQELGWDCFKEDSK